MKKLVKPSAVNGTQMAPASKSMMQRAIAIAALADGTSVLHNYTPCNDSDAALKIAENLGATVTVSGTDVTIAGGFSPVRSRLNCGEAGLGIRMFTPIASLANHEMVLEGEGSLKTRPVTMLEGPLGELGVDIKTNNGFVPITLNGPLKGGAAFIDGSMSSQMLTGMLIALPLAQNDTVLTVKDLKSKPYIDMTLEIMADFGITVTHDNYKTFSIKGNQQYKAREYAVEGDWSGASFPLAAAGISGSVTVTNLRSDSKQADIAFLEALRRAGASVQQNPDSVTVQKKQLNAFEFDANECPDLFPPLVSLAANCSGVTKLYGVGRLKHKESDRATVLKDEFAKLGVQVDIDDDCMRVTGGPISGAPMFAHNDHRIAMTAAVAALNADTPIEIENAECIDKSYPGFYDDFASIGAIVEDL